MAKTVKTVLTYTVEPGGKILAIDGPWDKFASENGANGLEREKLLGRNLFRYIAATGVVEAYKTMHRFLVDHPDKPLSFAYRCDSPKLRRDMRMLLEYDGGDIRYTSSLESTSPLDPPVVVNYLDAGSEIVRMCSWCKRIKYPEDLDFWYELERMFEVCPDAFTISHGICVECRQKLPYFKLGPITF